MSDLAADNLRLRKELRIAIAERELARNALCEIASGTASDPETYAAIEFKHGLDVRRRIEEQDK